MNYSGNMPDWHQYNSTQSIGSEVPSVGQNVNHSPIFGPSISPRRLNGPTFSPEGLTKPQNDSNYNPRNFQQSPNTINGPNVPPENSPVGSAPQMSGCHGPYGTPSPRSAMIEGTSPSLDSRSLPGSSLNEAIGQRNHQISMNRPAGPLNCSIVNGSMGPIGQRSTPTGLQGPIPTSNRQGLGSYMPCKGPCCNPDTNVSYQSWEKFGSYPPNVPYRDTGYPVDNRRFGNDFENREQLGTSAYNIDPRRNFPDYKYRKDSIVPRPYAHPPGVIQSYPVQNYNFPADYQKYPAYPMKEYPRDNSVANPQNPAVLKYQEQSVIVQQKYFTKQIQYQNGVLPKSIVSANLGGNVISRPQNPYFNPQLTRDFPRSYSDSTPLANRGIQTASPIHASYPKYQMYQQKIAMQRFSMENHLRELTRVPGYQSHPKYQESVLRYRELLRLQQTVDYQSTVQDPPKVVTSQVNEEIPPINLQFDQNGVLINTSFAPAGYSNLQSPINLQNSKNVQSVSNTEVGPQNLQLSEQFKTQTSIDNRVQDQDSSSLSRKEVLRKDEQRYSFEKDQSLAQKYESEVLNVANSGNGKTSSIEQKNLKDFADKPELDVRQFLANWDESEDEDGANANLPDVVLSNSTSGGPVDYENTKAVTDDPEESKNCSETEDCRSRDDCGMFQNTRNETKASNSTDNQIYQRDLPPGCESTKSVEPDSDTPEPGKKPASTESDIQRSSAERENETTLQIIENLANCQAAQGSVKLSSEEAESVNNNENQELPGTVKDDIIIKKESSIEEETITSITEHIEAYSHETNVEIRSSIKEIIENDDASRSSSGKESSDNTNHSFGSNEDLSESGDSNSMDSHSISSFIKSPKTIKGTEIHVDAQELSTITGSPKSNSEMLDSPHLQKQNSFTSEESHNPDDISLPDLPTSECTPISTTLNTPIHSDSEESDEPVIELTTPANPIEIIQNSPMLSFTHSPIKMELYEQFDENDLADKASHDALDFEFQANNSCDNEYEKSTDVSSHKTKQYGNAQNDEDTFDSDCVEILSEKEVEKIEDNSCEVSLMSIDVQNRFAFNKENVMATDKANITASSADHQPWPSVNVKEHKRQVSNNTEHQEAKSDIDKLETLSGMKDRSSIISEVSNDRLRDDVAYTSNAKHYYATSRWSTKTEIQAVNCESNDNMTALNLVKDENKTKLDSIKTSDKIVNLQVVPKRRRSAPSNTNEGIDYKRLDVSECNSSMEAQVIFPPTERAVEYVSSPEEDKIYAQSMENQSNFTGSLNIPLIPGEDFEEPKMPVLPMEGNCLTKIIKNTSPITDLDVLGSDDEKLDKMDEIWMEVGSVEPVGKVTDVNIDTFAGCKEGFDQEKNSSSRNKLRILQKNELKCGKNPGKAKDAGKLFGKINSDNHERDLKSTSEKNSQLQKSSSSGSVRKEVDPVIEDFGNAIIGGRDNTSAILQEKFNFSKVPIISKATRNSSVREDGNPKHDLSSANNATEIRKCKEKANHINDIATKLLQNARLFDPELRKMEVQRKESSSGERSRDSSKKRIKLLKEFRKVKNKMNIVKPEVQSTESVGTIENNDASSSEITEQRMKMDAETVKVNNVILNDQKSETGAIEIVMPESDSSITNSGPTLDSEVLQKLNINPEENILAPEERLKQTSNDGKVTSIPEGTPKENCSNVNMKDSITVEGTSSVDRQETLNTKVVNPFEEDINDCAINLSKSSSDFGLLQTLREKSRVANDSHSSHILEHIEIKEPIETERKSSKETIFTENNDADSILSRSLCADDNAIRTEIVKANNATLEVTHVELQNVVKGSHDCHSTLTFAELTAAPISKEDNKREIDNESTRTADLEEPEKLLNNLGVADLTESFRNPEKIVEDISENCKNCVDPIAGSNHNEVNARNDEVDQKPADQTLDSEATCNSEKIQSEVACILTAHEEQSMTLMKGLDISEEKPLSSHAPDEKTSIKSPKYSLRRMSNSSEEKVVKSVENCIEAVAVLHHEKNSEKFSVAEQLIESEPTIVGDGSINVQQTIQDLGEVSDIQKDSETIHKDPEIIESSTLNESLRQTQLEESTKTKWLQNTNLELASGTDKCSNTVDANSEVFGLENSFNYDFSNFDVAPNFSHTADSDQSNSWKCSKAYARFEDCERYKNPDNYVNPILTSLERLDNLNTVPVYTTKDGKITYSPNPKFTYRALIMEAREREGYPIRRESYYGNPRAQESVRHSRSQASFRKRKNSEGYGYSGSYNKKNYHEYYEPREHGESSTKNPPEPRNRSHFTQNKYSHQSRDRNTHRFTPHNGDAEKLHIAEKIDRERVSNKYKHRGGFNVLEEHNAKKNGTSDSFKCNNRKQYKQSKDESASNSVWSESKWDLKCDQKIPEVAVSKPETDKTTYNVENKNSKRTISAEKYLNNVNNDHQSKDLQLIEKLASGSDKNKHANERSVNISGSKATPSISGDTQSVEKICPDSEGEKLESLSSKTEERSSNGTQSLEQSNHEAKKGSIIKPGLFSSDWEDSCENFVAEQENFVEIKIPVKSSLDETKAVYDTGTKVNALYDGVDDICPNQKSDIDEKKLEDTVPSDIKSTTTSNSVKSPTENERFAEPDCNQERLNVERDESTITNAENEDALDLTPVQLVRDDKDIDEQKIAEIPETPSESAPTAGFNEETESSREEDKFDDSLHCKDDQMSLNGAENFTSKIKDAKHEDPGKEEIYPDKPNEFKSLNQISKVPVDSGALKSNNETSNGLKDSCKTQEVAEIEREEPKIKSYKIKSESKIVTSVKNQQPTSTESLFAKMITEYENTSKPQSQFENYIAYSPSNESLEDSKVVPKLVIKKMDGSNCKNVSVSPLSAASHDVSTEKVSDKDEHGSKASAHPKIPKILIRNAKSRPSTPSIEEVTEGKISSVSTKEDSKVPKVKIRFEEKSSRSPTVPSNENFPKTDGTESKIPKMKIKLEDRLPKVIIENVSTESCRLNEEVQKTIPKMKIKKFKGELRQIVDTKILPVSIPRMFIYTELASEQETSSHALTRRDVRASDKNSRSSTPNSIQSDQEIMKDTDIKKIPKLKIKRQNSGCSVELNRKRHSMSPIQSELKKVKKSLKLAESNDKKQSSKLSAGSEHQDSLKKLDSFNSKQSYELAASENVKYGTTAQSSECVRSDQTKSTAGNVPGTPEEIPKVIIKRASPSAEFKCELSQGRRDAIIKNKRWQPEVKLQRSWVLDCMAKDLNLDKLTLKLATPDSILRKSLPQKKQELGGTRVKNTNVNSNPSETKLFRSKSTSDLAPAHGSNEVFADGDVKQRNKTNATDLRSELIARKRCKSDLGRSFSKYTENFECKKKLKHDNNLSAIQSTLKNTSSHANDFANSSNIQSGEEIENIVENYQTIKRLNTNFEAVRASQIIIEEVDRMETSEQSSDKTLDENMNSRDQISTPEMNRFNSLSLNDETSDKSLADLDSNAKILPGSTSTTDSTRSKCECFESSNEFTDALVNPSSLTHEEDDSYLRHSANKDRERFEVPKDSVIVKNTDLDSIRRHKKTGKKHPMDREDQASKSEEKTVESSINENQAQGVINNIDTLANSVILRAEIPMKSDIQTKNSDICFSDASNNLEGLNCINNVHKLDINDNSDVIVKEADNNDAVDGSLMSHVDIAEQENRSAHNENVLIPSVTNNDEREDSDAKDVQESKIHINLYDSLDNALDSDRNSGRKAKSFEDCQTIIEILSDSPNLSQNEVEIQSCPDTIEENGVCLYHEDAIPTQFELELEIIDNTVPDPLEVPLPQNDQLIEDCRIYSGDEPNEDGQDANRILHNSEGSLNLQDSKPETTPPRKNDSNFSQVYSVSTYQREASTYPDKEGTILSVDIDERTTTNSAHVKTTTRYDSNDKKSLSSSDLLVKEVLAAKEKLRKCLGRSRNESRLKLKARPKTAAEKKQGLSFDLSTLGRCEESFTKLENHSTMNFILGTNSSRQVDQNLSSANKNEKLFQNQTKTEFKVHKSKTEKKHSKSSKSNLIEKKYSGFPTNLQKYPNFTEIEGYLIPKHSSLDIKDGVEFSKGETTISLKNSKYFVKNDSYSDVRKKTPELINSKDSKCRSKSTRPDVNSKYLGKSKIALPNTSAQESDLDLRQSQGKPVFDVAKNKYKSLKTSLDQDSNLTTDKTKFKSYKIPKIAKPTTPETERLIEDLQELHTKEVRMPILEPQVLLNGNYQVSDLNSDRETSRSPPVITNQESRAGFEITTRGSERHVSSGKDSEVLSGQGTRTLGDEIPEAEPSIKKETTVADIVNDMAYHEKATIRHRRYCTLCERWFPTVARHRRHLSGYQHRHTELTQRRTIHALFTLFTGRPCPRLQLPGAVRIDCEPGELTPLQIAVQGVTKEPNKVDGNIKKPTREDK